ncbi:Aha1 domain-containing protein [Forsythia ovata]|uniref:Aha1 domain-containing protein n=1 Tax=Forsythia ovata TaxID=205694 RepID=A0ABD1PG82_9LAMI
MARLREGDKRWIVEDRPDGANVHNWHWAETDCLEWSKTYLTNLLCNKPILNGEGNFYIRIKELAKLEGGAYVNDRKGKVIPGYELHLVLSYEADAKDSDGNSATTSTRKEKRKEGFKTITMSEKFSCRARDVYEILMDENRWKGFTQSNAQISKEVGGEFSIFDCPVTGTNVEL